jgi:hypothetical protein
LKHGTVHHVEDTQWGRQFHVQFDDGSTTVSDLRQIGWKHSPGVEMHHGKGGEQEAARGALHVDVLVAQAKDQELTGHLKRSTFMRGSEQVRYTGRRGSTGGVGATHVYEFEHVGDPSLKGYTEFGPSDQQAGKGRDFKLNQIVKRGMSQETQARSALGSDSSPAAVRRAVDQGISWDEIGKATGADVHELQKAQSPDYSASHGLFGGPSTHRTADDIAQLVRSSRRSVDGYAIVHRERPGHMLSITPREVDPKTGQAGGFAVGHHGNIMAWRQAGKSRNSRGLGSANMAAVHVAHAEDTGDAAGTLHFDWTKAETHDVHESMAGPNFTGRASRSGAVTRQVSSGDREALDVLARNPSSVSIRAARAQGIPWSTIASISGKSESTVKRLHG